MVKFSVLVPLYNAETYVQECLGSLSRQTMQDFEVIVCDNASSDKSLSRAKTSVGDDKRFRFVFQPDRGIEHALNMAFTEAKGEWIAFLDDDDLYHPQRLERTRAVIDDQNPDWVACRSRKIDDQGRPLLLPDGNPTLSQRLNFPVDCLPRIVAQRNIFGSFSNLAVRRECLAPLLPFPSRYNRVLDYYMLLGLIAQRAGAALIDEVIVDRRFHQNNVSGDYAAQQLQVFPLFREFDARIPFADRKIGCRLRTQRYLKAVQHLRRKGQLAAIKRYLEDFSGDFIDPDVYQCIQYMVHASLHEGRPRPAQTSPGHPLACFSEGLLHDDKLAAADCFEKARLAVPFIFPEALNNQAVCLAATQVHKAKALLAEALLFKPEYMDALVNAFYLDKGELTAMKQTVWPMDETWQAFIFAYGGRTC